MIDEALLEQELSEAEYDRIVRQDIDEFRDASEKYLSGGLTDDEFRPWRLRRGIYSQRQAGVQMIRTKVPGGTLTAKQMEQLAAIADEFAAGKAHLTTRQNVQYHFVPLREVPPLLHKLADVRMTTREACYNTVRNITACPLSGLLHDEVFDVRPYARLTALAFLHNPLTDSLPRKFKIAFSGCKEDCIAGAINDVGLRAVVRDGQQGFRVVVGGGLGPLPNEAQLLDEFLPAERLINRIEAVIRVFAKYGNRKNKNKARLKFVVRERGFDWVREQVDLEYQDILQNGGTSTPTSIPEGFGGFQSVEPPLGDGDLLPVLETNANPNPDYERWLETNIREQKHPGYAVVTVKVPQGNLTGDQMRGLAGIATGAGDGYLRFTMDQNVVLGSIRLRNLKRVYAALRTVDLAGAGAHEIDDIITCPGAYSCNLALTKSMNLGAALAETVRNHPDVLVRKLKINISGCPNSCGQHWIADLGFYGNARKIEGKEVPYYQMLLGGAIESSGVARFGLAVQSIPAKFAPEAVRRILAHYIDNRQDLESFRDYVLRVKVETFRALTADLAKPAELFPEIYQDWGDEVGYSLKLGRGECAS
jgi:sulfite reductase beta subunit-like hemoprotein